MTAETLEFEFRQPTTEDAQAVSKLFYDRYDDIIPGRQSWKPARKNFFKKHGQGYFVDRITRTEAHPAENFACMATVDGQLAGFACAIADPSNLTFARLVGLVVDERYSRQGVGTQLEIERQGWADVNNRVLYGQIGYEDEAAWEFYKKSGYQSVGTRAMEETVFRIIQHTPPNVPLATLDVPWEARFGNEPLLY